MNDIERIGLSSLAVSISAAVLFGTSNSATADEPYDHCAIGSACSLGYWQYFRGLAGDWPPPGYEGQVMEALPELIGQLGGGYYPTGVCQVAQPAGYPSEVCGCGGYAMGAHIYLQGYWSGQTWYFSAIPYWSGFNIFRPSTQATECHVP